jgi:hypothetical protein
MEVLEEHQDRPRRAPAGERGQPPEHLPDRIGEPVAGLGVAGPDRWPVRAARQSFREQASDLGHQLGRGAGQRQARGVRLLSGTVAQGVADRLVGDLGLEPLAARQQHGPGRLLGLAEEGLGEAALAGPGLAFEKREGPGAGRSDDSNFIDRRIPAINFFTGFHGDYHRPGDDWEKIDAAGTKRVATLALELAARLAERSTRPEFVRR